MMVVHKPRRFIKTQKPKRNKVVYELKICYPCIISKNALILLKYSKNFKWKAHFWYLQIFTDVLKLKTKLLCKNNRMVRYFI